MQLHRTTTRSLFDSTLFENSLLPWLPDETFFSLCSRHHRLWGYASSGRTAEILFGKRHAGTQHDLPSALDEFSMRTDEHLGAADAIARDKTLLRFYRPFLLASTVERAVHAMRSNSVAHLKYQLGLLTSRFRANHPLKACPTCMQQDVDSHGWAYWHLTHQFPGVWICSQHLQPLRSSTMKSTGVERFLWHLPNSEHLTTEFQAPSVDVHEALERFSSLITQLIEFNMGDGHLHHASVHSTLRARLDRNGLLTHCGSIRLKDFSKSYAAHCRPLRTVNELSALPATDEQAAAYLGRLLRPLRTGTHPLNFMSIIGWLFNNEKDFFELHASIAASQSMSYSDSSEKPNDPQAENGRRRRAEFDDLLISGSSVTAAAKITKIDVSTAMSWATEAGIQFKRRPKMLRHDLRLSLIQALQGGCEKSAAAKRHGVSIPTINRLLRTEEGLYEQWTNAQADTKRQEARRRWTALLEQHATLGVKLIRAMDPALYAWLYRNDRVWLGEHTPDRQLQASQSHGTSVRWDQRDLTLREAVLRAGASLAVQANHRTLKLWQFYQVIPELKAKLSSIDRLPLTKVALETLLNKKMLNPLTARLFD